VAVTPRVSLRYSTLNFKPLAEAGGAAGMAYDFESSESLQARAGFTARTSSGNIRPYVSLNYVHELLDQTAGVLGNFTLGSGNGVLFGFDGDDKNWGEAAAGITIGGENMSASLSAETTVFRSDYRNQTYRASISWRF
jgi:outer membrane autotransporter protein